MRDLANTPSDVALALHAARMRRAVIEMCRGPGQGYAGQGLELADLMAVLFHEHLREGDRFVLSTGHAAIALYAALWSTGRMTMEQLRTYGLDGTHVEESPLDDLAGFEVTGGSLGQGPSQAAGMALGEGMRGSGAHVVCVLSDGELQEGQVWEAVMFAAARGLSNLTLLVNDNGEQADGATREVLNIGALAPKFDAFGLRPIEVDGHDVPALRAALGEARAHEGPVAVIARTVPGKGVATFDRFARVHYVRTDAATWEAAADELDAAIEALS